MPARDFESIYAECSRMVYWTAYGVLKSQPDALDASQNVFLRVIKHMDKLKDMTSPQLKGWLYRVTVNLCLDDKRRQAKELLTKDGEDMEIPDADEAVLPEIAVVNEETRARIRSAIDALPDIYRETVVLHYFSELGYEEIAELTGSTEGTIKSRMFRAKARLAELLKEGELNG